MPGFLSRMFRRRTASVEGVSGTGGGKATKNLNRSVTSVNGNAQLSRIDAWEKTNVRREDVVELLKACCDELKARGTTPIPIHQLCESWRFVLNTRWGLCGSDAQVWIRRCFSYHSVRLRIYRLRETLFGDFSTGEDRPFVDLR